ncbi:hypothetical protein N7493_011262 [Penicillium malachiteum]|uniref:Uncharacterized protein n=1 Tax=Penicillium malachiteum TaxID=1324776 RepID=A0AAD6HC25_9EURO|nr:hypothetical protein N7493_011262 [Penicillium malachiteum]
MSSRATSDDEFPGPLTVRRCSVSQSLRTNSSSSYPRIPRRSSSVSFSVRKGSNGPATSTRTPSLCDSLYQIEVVKIRQPKTPNRRGKFCSDCDLEQDPFIENVTPGRITTKQKDWATNGYRLAPQLVVRWSSGSWDSSAQNSSPFLPNPRRATLELRPSQAKHTRQEEPGTLQPINGPVTFVNLRTVSSRLNIGMGSTSVWTTIYVSADVDPTPPLGASRGAPLDIIILLDNLRRKSTDLLAEITVGSSVLINHLTHNHDRIALAYVDQKSKQGFEILLPLGFHTIEVVHAALEVFSRRQLSIDQMIPPDVGYACIIGKAIDMFFRSPRAALCHLFFLSATPPDRLLIPPINSAIGFHTITPNACLPMDNIKFQSGWHISYTVGPYDTGPRDNHFIRRISKVVRQLRTGVCPGSVVNLKVSIAAVEECQVQSIIEDRRLISLRPGETWSIPVLIRVPPAFSQVSQIQRNSPSSRHPLIEEMMTQINFVLDEYSSDDITQPLLTTNVEYEHSLLPSNSKICVGNTLTIIRQKNMFLSTSASSRELSLGNLSQVTDMSFSQGSFSDSS